MGKVEAADKHLGITNSVCPECTALIPAKIVSDGEDVYFRKFCPEHGEDTALVYGDMQAYLKAQSFLKEAWTPQSFEGDSGCGCPEGCGFCEHHEQHLCMPIIEVTSRCNLACPVCINASGPGSSQADLPVEDFSHILEAILKAENQIDVLNISGGEPLIHPRILDLIDDALSRKEIARVSVSTNGLALLENPELIPELKTRNTVVSLQLDGFDDEVYTVLRGRPLLSEKKRILQLLADSDIATSLTMTAMRGVNDNQFGAMLDYFFSVDHVVSFMIQPAAYTGRGAGMQGSHARLTIPDIIARLDASGNPLVASEDFLPLPCSHPLCFSLAFYLMLDDSGAVPINRIVNARDMMDALANRVIFGLEADEYSRLKDMIYDLWSGPMGTVPESERILATLRSILKDMQQAPSCGGFDPQQMFNIAERRVKSIFIHAFQDADTFDLARVRKCCQAYPQPDGKLIPACVHNVMRRK